MTTIELDDALLPYVAELLLRGLRQTDPGAREYGEAFDAFAEAVDLPLRIGDQPDNVREAWIEIVEEGLE